MPELIKTVETVRGALLDVFARQIHETNPNVLDVGYHERLTSLGLDSLDLVEMRIDFEEILGEDISDEEEMSWHTVQDVMNTINKYAPLESS